MAGRISLTLLAAVLLSGQAPAPHGAIQVVVEGVAASQGRIKLEICTREAFTHSCALSAEAPAHAGTTMLTVRDVPPGTYAVQGFHDLNGNGKLDINFFGVPKEPVLFSRLIKLPYRRPRFTETSFDHGTGDQRIVVRLSSYF